MHCESIVVDMKALEHESSCFLEHEMASSLTAVRPKRCSADCPQRVVRSVFLTQHCWIYRICVLQKGTCFSKVQPWVNMFMKSDDSGCNSAALPVASVTSSRLFTWPTSFICFLTQGEDFSQHYRSEGKTGNINLA